ncbi:hypothetical protein [Laspinema olomoucense]|uniref:Uncharacterized protein n=1 Tax=Laspinema olomoucense D3b TaxID=2953688 RepID=A0ABT2N808_9CYAN|nr:MULTISPECIES: hypothetical protein [unclassified Laspinema]MCT7973269.1 hypothetical protein [Laspinema sp. D3d]MCT7978813.1 hypothetical protein [Laspinema sp. D3b]
MGVMAVGDRVWRKGVTLLRSPRNLETPVPVAPLMALPPVGAIAGGRKYSKNVSFSAI